MAKRGSTRQPKSSCVAAATDDDPVPAALAGGAGRDNQQWMTLLSTTLKDRSVAVSPRSSWPLWTNRTVQLADNSAAKCCL